MLVPVSVKLKVPLVEEMRLVPGDGLAGSQKIAALRLCLPIHVADDLFQLDRRICDPKERRSNLGNSRKPGHGNQTKKCPLVKWPKQAHEIMLTPIPLMATNHSDV